MNIKSIICLAKGHDSSGWMPHYWAPAHSWGEYRACLRCGKELEYKAPSSPELPEIEWDKIKWDKDK